MRRPVSAVSGRPPCWPSRWVVSVVQAAGGMSGGRRHLFAPTVAVLALFGTWIGHSLEYLRVGGRAGLRAELVGSVHVYMLPVGAMLIGLAIAGGMGWWRAWQALGRGLDAARAALADALRGHRGAAPAGAAPSFAARWGALALLLAGLSASSPAQIASFPTSQAPSLPSSEPPAAASGITTGNFTGSVAAGQANSTVLPLTLKDALDRGLRQNLGLVLAGVDVRSARAARASWRRCSRA